MRKKMKFKTIVIILAVLLIVGFGIYRLTASSSIVDEMEEKMLGFEFTEQQSQNIAEHNVKRLKENPRMQNWSIFIKSKGGTGGQIR
jgi:hypothetical protein